MREFLDGGVKTLMLRDKVTGRVVVRDMRSGSTVPDSLLKVQAQSVRRVTGRFGPGNKRWRVDYETEVPDGSRPVEPERVRGAATQEGSERARRSGQRDRGESASPGTTV